MAERGLTEKQVQILRALPLEFGCQKRATLKKEIDALIHRGFIAREKNVEHIGDWLNVGGWFFVATKKAKSFLELSK